MPWNIEQKSDSLFQVVGTGDKRGTFTFLHTSAIKGGGFYCTNATVGSTVRPQMKQRLQDGAREALRAYLYPPEKKKFL